MDNKDRPGPPETIENVRQLEELLSRPSAEVVELFSRLKGPLAIVGAGGKIGPSLVEMACRARRQAGGDQEIIAIDLFGDDRKRKAIENMGAATHACDLLDPTAAEKLPAAENVIYMVGMKFGTGDNPSLTWAINSLAPAYVARRYRDASIVAFSTGCVYDFAPADSPGSIETDALTPPGEYANSCVARERILQHSSLRYGTKMVLLRLNYAVEMRYGVLVDIAADIAAGRDVDVSMGYVNVIWQGDVNAAALRLLDHAASPPKALNLTGAERLSVRELARQMAERMGKPVTFAGTESPAALLSDSSAAAKLLGEPATPIETVVKWTAEWAARGGELLGKPTHFQTGDGKY